MTSEKDQEQDSNHASEKRTEDDVDTETSQSSLKSSGIASDKTSKSATDDDINTTPKAKKRFTLSSRKK